MMKYGNKKIVIDGASFDSKREFSRYQELLLLEKAGVIDNLVRQKEFILIPSQKLKQGIERSVKYVADFVYEKDGLSICEDLKGFKTKDYIIKRKLMKFIHNIEILESK